MGCLWFYISFHHIKNLPFFILFQDYQTEEHNSAAAVSTILHAWRHNMGIVHASLSGGGATQMMIAEMEVMRSIVVRNNDIFYLKIGFVPKRDCKRRLMIYLLTYFFNDYLNIKTYQNSKGTCESRRIKWNSFNSKFKSVYFVKWQICKL